MQHDKRTYLLPQFLLSFVSKDGVGMDIETSNQVHAEYWKMSERFHSDQLRDHEELTGRRGKKGISSQNRMLCWRHLLWKRWSRRTAGPDSDPYLGTEPCPGNLIRRQANRLGSTLQFEQWGLASLSQHKHIGIGRETSASIQKSRELSRYWRKFLGFLH